MVPYEKRGGNNSDRQQQKDFAAIYFLGLKVILHNNQGKQIARLSWHSAAKDFFFFLEVLMAGTCMHMSWPHERLVSSQHPLKDQPPASRVKGTGGSAL